MIAPLHHPETGLLPRVPRVKWEPEAPRDAVLAVACETCSASPGQDCDGTVYSWFILGYYMRGLDGIHAARYRSATMAAAKPAGLIAEQPGCG